MDINELESFNMSDAVKFHDELNPDLWINSRLDPEVRDQLLLIAEDFITSLGISDLDVVDITVSGSNAAYSYTPHSDLDLHVLVDMSKLRNDEIYRELFTAKKTLYNDSHDITVHGVPVEMYVQDVHEPVKSLGEYSVLNDKWIRIPKKSRANFDQAATKAKFDNLAEIVELALKTADIDRVEKAIATIKRYRKAGLDKAGEFGPENLAFKAIRKQGGIQDLYDLRDRLKSEKLSIEEATSREDAIVKIYKLRNTAGRNPNEMENIKRIIAKMMKQYNIQPAEIGIREPVDPVKAKMAKAAYTKQTMQPQPSKLHKGIFAEDHDLLNKPTLSVEELADKHGVTRMDIAKQLDKGIKVELEHTKDKSVAREIALDHLAEDPKYYDKLATVELEEASGTSFRVVTNPSPTALYNLTKQSVEKRMRGIYYQGKTYWWDAYYAIHAGGAEELGIPYNYLDRLTSGIDSLSGNYQVYGAEGVPDKVVRRYDIENELAEAFDPEDFRRQMAALRAKEELKKTNPIAALAQDLADKEKERLAYKPKKDEPSARASWQDDPARVSNIDYGPNWDPFKGPLDEEQLDETAQESQLINLISKKAAAIIFKMLRKKESTLARVMAPDSKRQNLEIYGISAEKLGVPYVNDPVLYTVLSNSDFRVVNYPRPLYRGTIATYDSNSHDITVYYPTLKKEASRTGYETEQLLAKTLAHEIQHAVDNLKSRGKAFDTNKKSYATLPYEINARFQEALMNMTMEFDRARKEGKTLGREHLPGFIDSTLEHNGISQFLPKTGSRYKQLAKRMFKFFDAELNNPKKEQPLATVKRAMNWILDKPTAEIHEASGYIPSAKEKNDPRFKTALTVDVKPDAIKKNAKAFSWKTSRAGIPPQANPNGKLAEDLMREWKSFLAEDEQQEELFPGYDEQHKQQRLDNWLQSTHAWDGHKPMVFYHATAKDFDTFNTHGTGFASALGMAFEVERHGSFFAVDPKFAESFIEKPDWPGEYKEGGRVIPVYLSVQNPIDLRDNSLSRMLSNEETVEGFKANDIDLWSIYQHIGEYERWELFDGPEGGEFVENLQKLGFDGAIITEMVPNDNNAKSGEVWVVFNPNQVKSVHNRGSFSPDDPSLMKENG